MLIELFLLTMNKNKKGSAPSRPDQYNYDRLKTFYTPRPQTPINNPAPLPVDKTTETIPSGENRVVFNLTAPGTFTIFTNPANLSVEVSEVLIVASVAGTVQLFLDEAAIIPAFSLGVNGSYSDSGFRLPINSKVNLALPDTAIVSGFLRWRYK